MSTNISFRLMQLPAAILVPRVGSCESFDSLIILILFFLVLNQWQNLLQLVPCYSYKFHQNGK